MMMNFSRFLVDNKYINNPTINNLVKLFKPLIKATPKEDEVFICRFIQTIVYKNYRSKLVLYHNNI